MDGYEFDLKDGSKAELFLSPNLDFLIRKDPRNKIDGDFRAGDCIIDRYMPRILRFCYEKNVDLMENKFLKNLPKDNEYKIDELPSPDNKNINKGYILDDFRRSLKEDKVAVRSKGENLILCCRSCSPVPKWDITISFNKEDVSNLVEGIIKVLDYGGIRLVQKRSIQIIQYYHECLDNKLLR